jgi:undecaprenyl-diphosphatase
MVSKTIVAQVTVGSNPTPSALTHDDRTIMTSTRASTRAIGAGLACAAFLLLAITPAGAWAANAARDTAARSLGAGEAAVLLGLSMPAAVEFSFLLGFVTLAAATAYEMLSSGKTMIDTFGIAVPLIGLVVAFAFAAVSIRWMVTYLSRHDLSVFGWYRIGVALIVLVLLATNAI